MISHEGSISFYQLDVDQQVAVLCHHMHISEEVFPVVLQLSGTAIDNKLPKLSVIVLTDISNTRAQII